MQISLGTNVSGNGSSVAITPGDYWFVAYADMALGEVALQVGSGATWADRVIFTDQDGVHGSRIMKTLLNIQSSNVRVRSQYTAVSAYLDTTAP